ncbi:hypothetical protein BV898_19863 [Hypsibius exemplaris]|uniref:Uncharacterized protein n=1 Tax=Hypsibius exemplaris TaxID=2072580 RepID=A0A9X6RQ51_HYPEX|nr:hypothetical protein BV898_19863 [Hypsibius exemplaris]
MRGFILDCTAVEAKPTGKAWYYNVSQSVASLATGIPGVFSAFLGIFIGSFLIKRFKMEPRHVSLLTAGAAIIGAAAYFIVIAFGCEQMNIIGIDDTPDRYNL